MNPLIEYSLEYYKYPKTGHTLLSEYGLEGFDKSFHRDKRDEFLNDSHTEKFIQKYKLLSEHKNASNHLKELVMSHGIFAQKFFIHSFLKSTRKQSRSTLDDLLSGVDAEHSDFDEGDSVFFYWATNNIFLYELRKNYDELISLSNDWLKENMRPKKCLICDREYRVCDMPEWVYFGTGGKKRTCLHCNILEKPLKDDIPKFLVDFIGRIELIPNASFTLINPHYVTSLSESAFSEVAKSYARTGGVEHVKKKYGSWFKALASSGVLPNDVLVTTRGVRCIANDGHECNSLDERYICDYLHRKNVKHEKEPHYPVDEKINPKGLKRADWLVGETLIEYFGLAGDKTYDKKTDKKILLAKKYDIPLIAIYPEDINNLSQALGAIID